MENGPEPVICRALGAISNPNGSYKPTDIAVYFNREIIDSIFKNDITLEKFHKWLKMALYPALRSTNEA